MKKLFSVAFLSAMLSTSAFAAGATASGHADDHHTATGDAAAGQTKAAACGACHGATGVSSNPLWPNLAGQGAPYIASQLHQFKSGARNNAMMNGQAAGLSDQDILDIAAYFEAQPARVGSTAENLLAPGALLYRAGDAENGISACIACHGPQGKGNAAAGFPALSGQQDAYVAAALKAYRSGERGDPKKPHQMMMLNVASKLTDAQIDAVSAYVSGLH